MSKSKGVEPQIGSQKTQKENQLGESVVKRNIGCPGRKTMSGHSPLQSLKDEEKTRVTD